MHAFDHFFQVLGQMKFAHPHLLWFLLIIPFYVAWYVWKRHRQYAALTISTTAPLVQQRTFRWYLRHLPAVFRCLALAFLIIALARPQTSDSQVNGKTIKEGIDVIMALDVSGSMDMMDFKPTRLEACKQIAAEFVQKRENDNVGLVLYAGEAYTLSPPTTDHNYFLDLLKTVKREPLIDGTAIGDGLGLAVSHLKDSKAKSKVVILLSDGVNNAGYIDPRSAATMAKEYNIKVYTISCGTNGRMAGIKVPGHGVVQSETVLDEALMKEIAATTGGKYFSAGNEKKLREVYGEIDKLETTRREEKSVVSWANDHFLPFLVIAIFCFLLEIITRLGLVRVNLS